MYLNPLHWFTSSLRQVLYRNVVVVLSVRNPPKDSYSNGAGGNPRNSGFQSQEWMVVHCLTLWEKVNAEHNVTGKRCNQNIPCSEAIICHIGYDMTISI